MSGNESLNRARGVKNDEFYTQLIDIEEELIHYQKHFAGKVVYCNCDNPEWSNFWNYFELNFESLNLKKLIATYYNWGSPSYKLELMKNENGKVERIKTQLTGDGDFRSDECIEILKEADIVVTNPPFSIFREYIAQLMKCDKQFLVIGSQNAIACRDVFSLIKTEKLWLGNKFGGMSFKVPNDSIENFLKVDIGKDGNAYKKFGNVAWFTNLDYDKSYKTLTLHKVYSEEEYPKYVNYDAINVDKTKDIPVDYDGVMGVPISFMGKYNPEQFEIVTLGIVGSCEFTNHRKMEIMDKNGEPTGKFTANGKGNLYRKFNPKKDKVPSFRDVETGELYISIYARVLIKRRTG